MIIWNWHHGYFALKRTLAVQKEVEGPILSPALFKKYDEDRIVEDVWFNDLQRFEQPRLDLSSSREKLKENRKVFDLEDVQNKVIDLLRKDGWNVDGTRIDLVDSVTSPVETPSYSLQPLQNSQQQPWSMTKRMSLVTTSLRHGHHQNGQTSSKLGASEMHMPNIPNIPNTDSKSYEMSSYWNEKHHEEPTTKSAIDKLRSRIRKRPRRTSVTD